MSSTDKTANLSLNQWVASDRPKREDFNYDNELIDRAFTNHNNDEVRHITAEEREAWNNGVYLGMYFGDDQTERRIETGCPFEPVFVVVFGASRPLSFCDYNSQKKYNFIGLASPVSSTINIAVEDGGATLVVNQDLCTSYKDEYTCLNQLGVAYTYIMFR
ncbi:MAG: hypothetical protein PUE08_03570 [Eubacteriales bacterium]|nr:hypothetical protein [Eubacteriales bacterium]